MFKKLPHEINFIVLDKLYQLEHSNRFEKTLKFLKKNKKMDYRHSMHPTWMRMTYAMTDMMFFICDDCGDFCNMERIYEASSYESYHRICCICSEESSTTPSGFVIRENRALTMEDVIRFRDNPMKYKKYNFTNLLSL